MKLRYQNIVLTGLPLVCQLVFVGILVLVNINLEKAASAETHAKKVLASCDELRMALFANFLTLTTMRMTESKEYVDVLAVNRERIKKKVAALEDLTSSDRSAQTAIKHYTNSISHMQSLSDEMETRFLNKTSVESFRGFLNEREFFEELAVYSKKMTDEISDINAIYTPIVQEMKPEAAARRKTLQNLLLGGVLFNVSLTVFLAWSFRKNTVRKLEFLLLKIKEFARGKSDSPPLEGNDELTELDSAFREMAAEKAASEELKANVQAMVSHDIRAPLTSMLGMVQVLRENVYGELPPKADKTMMQIESEINRLVRLANDLLDMERLERGALELKVGSHCAMDLVSTSLESVKGLAAAKQIELSTDVPPDLMVTGDYDRIVQVLVNLLSNAVKFSPRKSVVTAKVRQPEGSMKVRFEIIDQGKGLSEEELKHVFEKFKQMDQDKETKQQGSGLGLFICKSLIQAHNGNLGVESVQGNGCCFWFEL